MKILHVYKDYHPVLGGIERHIKLLAEAQVAAGHVVHVLVTNPGNEAAESNINGVKVIRTRSLGKIASTPLSVGLLSAFKQQQPDIVHLHFPYPVGEMAQFLFGNQKPFVVTYHADALNPAYRWLYQMYSFLIKKTMAKANCVIATSQNYINSSHILGSFKEKCKVVPLGIDPVPFSSAQPLVAPASEPTLLFVGVHRYYKGLEYLLEAIKALPIRLLVSSDGPMRSTWERQAEAFGVADRVKFLGMVPEEDLPGLYASADVFVLPASMRSEAFGTVLLEAMAAGLPCITTELGTGTSFVVQHDQTGLVVPPRDPQALTQAIARLLADQPLRERLSAAGRERVQALFTTQQMLDAVQKIYTEVIN